MSKLALIAAELVNKPLLCTAEYAETVMHVLGERIGIDNSTLSVGDFSAAGRSRSQDKGFAHIQIIGSMTHRASWLEAESGMRSYEAIAAEIDEAAANFGTIVLEFDTPGGAVSGAFDLADKIRGHVENGTRMIAYVNDLCASAGYLLAAQCSEIHASQTARIGSIGVVLAHVDRSKELEMKGLKPTFIIAGERKVDGNSAQPLSPEVKGRLQDEINTAYDMFVNAVVEGRPQLSADEVRATEAGVFLVDDAIKLGLADGVATIEEVFAMAKAPKGVSMSEKTYTQAEFDAAVKQAAADENSRLMGVIGGEHYAGREKMAHKLLSKGMAADDVNEILAEAPVAAPAATIEDAPAEKADAGAAQKAALAALANENSDVEADASEGGAPTMTAEQARIAEARETARSFNAARQGKTRS